MGSNSKSWRILSFEDVGPGAYSNVCRLSCTDANNSLTAFGASRGESWNAV